ncbi:MAG: GntR family transcriptional regulator [Burkholderiales bacterium]|nr:GntR family transcriptional regulator [Burkholderiales bacterium]
MWADTAVNEKTSTLDGIYRVPRVAAPLRQSVVESIRNSIASGHFSSGERLIERELCDMTGVSRTLVREALRQLESEGLVHVVPNRGPVVAQVTVEQAQEIYQLRRELEGLASELFARHASAAEQQEIDQLVDKLATAIDSHDARQWLALKNEFYDCLLRGSGNATLGQMLGLLNTRITVLRATSLQHNGRARQSLAELREVVDALLVRDASTARAAMVRHVENAAKTAAEVLRKSAAD